MHKKELIEEIQKRIDNPKLTKADITKIVEATFDVCADSICSGVKVSIPEFGVFSAANRAATTARNPHTGEVIEVPAKRVAKFTPASKLKQRLL